MTIIKKQKDFRGLENYIVKRTKRNEDVKGQFIKRFPYHDISIIKEKNDLYEISIIPFECASF